MRTHSVLRRRKNKRNQRGSERREDALKTKDKVIGQGVQMTIRIKDGRMGERILHPEPLKETTLPALWLGPRDIIGDF